MALAVEHHKISSSCDVFQWLVKTLANIYFGDSKTLGENGFGCCDFCWSLRWCFLNRLLSQESHVKKRIARLNCPFSNEKMVFLSEKRLKILEMKTKVDVLHNPQ